jgi:hypothetical protein
VYGSIYETEFKICFVAKIGYKGLGELKKKFNDFIGTKPPSFRLVA